MDYEKYVRDALHEAQEIAGIPRVGLMVPSRRGDLMGIVGYGVAVLPSQRRAVPFGNLVTTAGDQYYARKAIAAISPASASAPTAMSGMKLGTSTTAATKSSTGAALVTYLTGSNAPFDASYPQVAAVAGTDTGWYAIYQTTWAAGTATSATINEVAAVNDAGTNGTSTAANTYARGVFASTVDKASNEPLIVIWNHKFLGA